MLSSSKHCPQGGAIRVKLLLCASLKDDSHQHPKLVTNILYVDKSMWTFDHRHPFQILEGLAPTHFYAALTVSTFLGRRRCIWTCMWDFGWIRWKEHLWGQALTCWTRRLGWKSMFQFSPKVFSWVEVKILCRLLQSAQTELMEPRLYRPWHCAQGHSHAGTGKDLPIVRSM